ncbi:MAG: hypothetical protein US68_C0017G0016 [Candidatus Shapirobacteria bacterium GW2011_GWE1_38_10]|uniref:Aminoglycoside phosphotransferase domain-containing protein n=1 Tax=Candidatus Shapirobacteria bacterium GW2011_GWE1_38_10 TaxID=1618488 RepID=A0A0G0IE37_9BACT|nr:MAG: hypothetical protein US46_C0011G0003 [Candidatus Shapirobacteria bacterium GW2011_GWF2_37_20]KKQ49235.1 MAG: hypothetical protein US68_C0017G0016 [Candidatus Shapirobacteria bacterium GW2011_GWE1_38_10]KKQ62881.1 MAG: hypothetical protein US85_C0021G0010 [Candidatus Shapirobacteria bacterium GW2011_GWF1_38_23]HBP50799.1 hypothetical protein [Candidatus Shapirobacteria bacterium]
MPEKLKFNETAVANCLLNNYGIEVVRVVPIDGGADQNALVFKVESRGSIYFLKQKPSSVDDSALVVQDFLHNQDISEVLSPIKTNDQKLSASINQSKLVLYPYIEGFSNAEKPLSEQNWIEFGQTLKKIHSANIPESLQGSIRLETYSTRFPKDLVRIISQIHEDSFTDPTTLRMVEFFRLKEEELNKLLLRTDQLCSKFKAQSRPLVLCHSDIHAGNRFVDKNGGLRIIDFDEPIFAPIERDLMFIGSGIIRPDTSQEIDLFYRGYGKPDFSLEAIAYYRCQRIIEDIVLYAEDVLYRDIDVSDKATSLDCLVSNFNSGGPLEFAYQTIK